MPFSLTLFLFLLVIIFANVMQTITGFAGTVLAMPFAIMLMGSEFSRTTLNILGLLASLGVVLLNRKSINWKEVLKISIIMLVGMVGGYLILGLVDISKQVLLIILASFVFLFTIIGCYTTFIKKEGLETKPVQDVVVDEPNPDAPKEESVFGAPKNTWYKEAFLYALLIAAGVVHGMYVCGGPLLIIYATKKLKDKDEFRSTLSMVWVVLNGVNLVRDIIAGSFVIVGGGIIETVAAMVMPVFVLFGAIAFGNILAKRMNKRVFMIITYVLMAISATSLILNAFGVI